VTANPSKVITIHDKCCISSFFDAKNITAAFAKPAIWPISRLAYKDFEPSSVTPKEKEIHNQEISVPSASTPVA
jgi:hypothetical protein